MEEIEKIRKEPYKYIPQWMESTLIHVGKPVFEILSLLPASLILPDIPFGNKNIRPQMNALLLSPPSGGKSTIAEKFAKISTFPITFRRITASELISQILINPYFFTIINEDFSQVAEDYDVIKVLEGVTGDERKIEDKTSRRSISKETKGVCLLCGTPSDLSRYLKNLEGGMFFRLIPIMINHTTEQHSDIGKHINDKIGNYEYIEDIHKKEETVIEFYKELGLIQSGKHPTIPAIARYKIPDEIKNSAFMLWDKITREMVDEMEFYWIRELHEFYRFLVSHALLNVHNRTITKFKMKNGENKEVECGEIHIQQEDYKVAINLMKRNIKFKYYLIKATRLNSKIRDAKTLKEIMETDGLNPLVKDILMNISPHSSALLMTKNF